MADKVKCTRSRIGEAWLIECGEGNDKLEMVCVRTDKNTSAGAAIFGFGAQAGISKKTCDCFFLDELDTEAKKKIADRLKKDVKDIDIEVKE